MKKPKYTKEWGTHQKEEKKKKIKKEAIWTALIAFIMVSSIIGFMYVGEDEPEFIYKDKYEFVRRNNVFIYEQDNQEFSFRFFPSELEELSNGTDLSNLKKPMFYITFDPETELVQSIDLSRFELANELPSLGVYVSQAITDESEIYNLPVVNCENATMNEPVLKFEEGNETGITEEGYCFIFTAKNDYDVAKLKDIIVYTLLGIL